MRQVTLALWVVLASVPLPFFMDFVSDIRRSAAGLDLKDKLEAASDAGRDGPLSGFICRNKVTFRRVGQEDPKTESFLRQWLGDVAEVEAAGDVGHRPCRSRGTVFGSST